MAFIIDKEIPEDITNITMSYTFFELFQIIIIMNINSVSRTKHSLIEALRVQERSQIKCVVKFREK